MTSEVTWNSVFQLVAALETSLKIDELPARWLTLRSEMLGGICWFRCPLANNFVLPNSGFRAGGFFKRNLHPIPAAVCPLQAEAGGF